MNIHNSIMGIHYWTLDIHNRLEIWISIIVYAYLLISIIQIMDIRDWIMTIHN